MAQLKLKKEETIFKQGDVADCLYYIRKGRVAIVKEIDGKGPEKRQITMNVLGRGDIFGELALFSDREQRSANAIVISDTCVIDRVMKDDFFSDLGHTSDFIAELFRQLVQRFLKKEESMFDEMVTNDFLALCYIINMFRTRQVAYDTLIQTGGAILDMTPSQVESLLEEIQRLGLIRFVTKHPEQEDQVPGEKRCVEIVGFRKSFMIAARKVSEKREGEG